MSFQSNHGVLLGAASAIALMGNTQVQAQTQPQANPQSQTEAVASQSKTLAAAQDGGVVQEIVVTAEKRSNKLTTTPVAMSALSGAALKDKEVVNLQTLTSTTPSLTVSNQGPTNAVNIRGIGLSVSSPNVASGVPIYRDGLFTTTLLSNEPFFDIQDVEVLRGPQGTLVGANSTGGAVFINSISPKIGQVAGYIEGKVGTYNDYGVQGAINIPISDVLAARLAVNWEKRDSYWKDDLPTDGKAQNYPGAMNQNDIRFSLLYQPNSQFSVLLKTNFQLDEDGGLAHTPEAGTPAAVGYPTSKYHLSYVNGDTYYRDYQSRTRLEAKYIFDNGVTVRSVSGFTYTHEHYSDEEYTNLSTTAVVSTPLINHIEDHLFTQEFNVLSPASDQFHWVAGTYSEFWPAKIKLNAPTTAPVYLDNGTDKVSNAVFGEAGYNFTSALELHVGARYTFDRTYSYGGTYLLLPSGQLKLASNDDTQTDGELTGRIGLNWKATPDQFVYAFVAKGSKTGGINGPAVPNFSPEAVYDYELGLKSTWFNGHLKTQLGGFYMNYDNLQLTTTSPTIGNTPQQSITNAGSARIDGAELAAQSRFGALQIDGNVAYVDSSVSAGDLLNTYLYTIKGLSPSGLQCATGQTAGCFNYAPYYQSASGVPNPYSPKWTANIGAQYEFELGDDRSLTPRVDFSYTSSQYSTVFENPVDKFQVRHLLNFHLTYAQGPWKAVGYATNVTNDYYIVGQTANQNFWGAPSEYGFRLSYTY